MGGPDTDLAALPHLQGPGDNTSTTDPYLLYTGRTYNDTAVPGVMRVKQGTQNTNSCRTIAQASDTRPLRHSTLGGCGLHQRPVMHFIMRVLKDSWLPAVHILALRS